MPVTPTYNLAATACPAITRPDALLDPDAAGPLTWKGLTAGVSALAQGMVARWNGNASRGDLTGRWGGGGYAAVNGLALSDGGGLTLNVAAGQAMIDGPVTVPAGTVALTDASQNYIWLTQAHVLTKVLGSLAAPATRTLFLGRVTTAGGIITAIDLSGVCSLRGGTLYRRTADAGQPADTPPADLQLLTVTVGGAYWWDGSRYWAWPETLGDYSQATGYTLTSADAGTTALGDCLYAFGSDTFKRAKADAAGTARVIGLASASIAASGSGVVYTAGLIAGLSGLTAGLDYYLDDANAGKLVATPPSTAGHLVTRIGTALSATELRLGIQPPLAL